MMGVVQDGWGYVHAAYAASVVTFVIYATVLWLRGRELET